jgi:Tetratricopeptide repeat
MKLVISIAILIACGLAAGPHSPAQSPAQSSTPAPSQSKPSDKQNTPRNPQQPASQSNPFPEDTTSVPLMPNGNTPADPDVPTSSAAPSELPKGGDVDPVRSPDDAMPDSSTAAQGFSSSTTGMDRILPPPDTDSNGRDKNHPAPEHQETAAEDESVGSYYLDQKNWKAALSRFESAVVLDPENPEVYWGLGEAQHHLGKFSEAKASYQKLVDYDPDSKHGKEARKLLKDPDLANAPTASAAKP